MALTKAFTDAVASGDIRGIRIMMKDSLLVDLTFHDFNEMSRLAAKVPGLYDAHDGRTFVEDSSAWNDDYMNKLMVQVVGNFSHERLDHLKEVVRYLRPISERQCSAQEPHYETGERHQRSVDYETQKAEDARNGRIVKIAGGTAVGAVVGGVGAAVAGATTGAVIVCAAVGAAAGGVIVASTTKGV
jgi:hypothetical protein